MNVNFLSKIAIAESAAGDKKKVKAVDVKVWAIAGAIGLGITLIGLRIWCDRDAMLALLTGVKQGMMLPANSADDSYLAVGNWLDILNLKRLPMEMQNILSTVLLLPLGSLLIAVCRNLIGLTTCGTFAPLLLALGLALNDWKVGLIMILSILLIGVGIRGILDPLKMLVVPRQSIIVTFVVFFIIFSVSTIDYLELKISYHAVLLPVVILTGLIEQLFVTIEEQGKYQTTEKLLGTLIVGCCCYGLLSSQGLGRLLLSYPELHCLTIAGTLSIGGYSGYRVSELFRFRDFVDPMSGEREHFTLELRNWVDSAVSDVRGKLSAKKQGLLTDSIQGVHPIFANLVVGAKHSGKKITTLIEKITIRMLRPCPSEMHPIQVAEKVGKNRRWIWPQELRDRGIVGINRRNGEYVLPYNPRGSYKLVDNKVLTKELGAKNGVPFPETYGIVARFGDIKRLEKLLAGREEFVIKPAKGSGGKGIMVIVGKQGEEFVTANGKQISLAQLQSHLSMILSGNFSLGGDSDVAIIEQRIEKAGGLEAIAVGGTPDIRVILFRGVPVMAMTRLPTSTSGGRANLHQGAIAAGIDLLTGKTCGGVYQNRIVSVHPDTGNALEGFQIPHWEEILNTTIILGNSLNLEYLGVDLVIDADHGPMVLEVNARPGLAIQIANRCGLRRRLEFVKQQPADMLTPDRCWELIPQLSKMR